jgi:hypothetical protein
MSKKSPPAKDIKRIRNLLNTASSDTTMDSADLQWALKALDGEKAPPPGEAVRPEVAYALVEELVELKRAEILEQLAQVEHKTVSKAARKGLHRLRSQKVAAQVPAQSTQRPSGTGMAIQQELHSLVSIYDGRWDRLVWLADDAPSGVQVYQARVSALHGLMDFRTGSTSRKEYRARIKDIRQDLGGELIDREQAIWFVQEAAQRCRDKERDLPVAYTKASQVLGHAPRGGHPAVSIEPAAVDSDELVGILELDELRYWLPERMVLQRLALKLSEVATSRVIINEQQRAEQFANHLDRAVEEYFTAECCAACRRLLLDTAHLFVLGEKPKQAALLRAAADLFARPPEEVVTQPLARTFLERLVRPPDAQPDQDAESEDQPAPETKTEGGLILPGRGA